MSNLFSTSVPETPTPFQRDIKYLVEKLNKEVSQIHAQYRDIDTLGVWIYGYNNENRSMSLFMTFANPIVEQYSQNFPKTEPKNIYEVDEFIRKESNQRFCRFTKGLDFFL